MHNNNYALEVQVNGRPAREFYKNGKAFIEGREGSQYTLKFRNNSWKRVLAVFSVDGIEVIEGKVASEFKGGYVIDPYSSIEIKGYRIDENSVAGFRFAKTHKSYANTVGGASVDEKTGEVEYTKTTRNNGVIGVRVYEEKEKPVSKNISYVQDGYAGYGVGGYPIIPPIGYASGFNCTGSIVTVSGINLSSSSFRCATGYAAALNNINSTVNGSFEDEQNGKTRGRKNRIYYPVIGVSPTPSTSVPFRPYDQHEVVNLYSDSSTYNSHVDQIGQVTNSAYSVMQSATTPDFNLGTTWGEKVADKVKEVDFQKSEVFTDIEIYYDSRDSLAAYGIDFEATKQIVKWPSAFESKKKFCKVPEGYNG